MKTSVNVFALRIAIAMTFLTFVSCNESFQDGTDLMHIPSVTEMVTDLYINYQEASYEEIEEYVCNCYGITPSDLVSVADAGSGNYISQSALQLVDSISTVDPSTFHTKADYVQALTDIVVAESENIQEGEKEAIIVALSKAADVIELQYGEIDSRAFKDWVKKQWDDWGRCVSGTVDGAGLGALAGAGIAAIPTVGIGAPVGAIIGGISGALSGAASAC